MCLPSLAEPKKSLFGPLKTLGAWRGIADQIDNLKARIKQVKELKDSCKLNDVPSITTRPAPRYLIIIDDIWSTSAWDALKYAFPENSCSSRIIVTTRIVDVARSCCQPGRQDSVYEMQPLTDDHSKSLFFRRIFGSGNCCPEMLKEISSEILKKCGGLPLAIISISGLLANKQHVKEEWEMVKRSIGSALEKSQNLEGMSKILSLSYNSLPPKLKTCLLYLSVFPEDYEIERERIVRRWIAEGFISEERGQSRQEVAEKYFYELINKNMVQPVDISYDSKVRACRVHDIMLEILISKSAEDNFITVLGGGQMSLANRNCFIRRLSVQDVNHETVSALANEDLSHVRSLTISSGCIKHLPSLVEFEALRVLDFEDCNGWDFEDHECLDDYIMDGIEKLLQLKYLGLRGTQTSKIPLGIGMLGDLETLDLRETWVQELPAGINRLTKLEYLLAEGQVDMSIPSGIGKMRNLRVISGFTVNLSLADTVSDLGNLASLNELHLLWGHGGPDGYKSHEDMLLSSLCKLSSWKLKDLRIDMIDGSFGFLDSWSPSPSLVHICLVGGYYFTSVPKWIGPVLTSLASVDINLTELTVEGMHTLGELKTLLHLKLSLKPKPVDRVIIQGVGFPSLKEFVLYSFDGAYITFVKGAMPKLQNLTLFPIDLSLAQTYSFYLGIEHLPCLKKVIWFYNYGATSSQRKAAMAGIKNEAVAHPNHLTLLGGENNEENRNDEEKTKEDDGADENVKVSSSD
uniref:Uncharacterized protein n=1 Tax=Avena sativa TaxID=4498 RepID=A0ACD6A8S4_AVESA